MKRYRDCALLCIENQSANQLMSIVEQKSIIKGYKVVRASSLVNNDTLGVRIKVDGLPVSNLVIGLESENNGVEIFNIVPLPESEVSHIDQETYNNLLDAFTNDVFQSISKEYGNRIVSNTEDYTIKDIIPKSFEKLNKWLDNYPLSAHQCDTYRWYDFIISLHETGEHLSGDDLGKYVKEEYGWNDDDINRIERRLESHLGLLNYYDANKRS